MIFLYFYPDETKISSRFTVVCTTSILADTVRAIGGEYVHVIALMGPGIDPHLYRAREGDVHRLAQASLVLYHGLHLEGRMTDIFTGMKQYTPTVAVCDAIPITLLRESEFKGVYDPHVWHDIHLWRFVVECVRDALAQYDPEHYHAYQQSAACYMQELEALEQYIHEKINQIPISQRKLVTAHDAFTYFGAAYGIEVIALQGISTESDISTRDVIDLADFVVTNNIRTLFLESSIAPRNIQAVQEAVLSRGWQVQLGDELYSDALGDAQSGANTYISMLKHNVDAIVKGLN